MQIQTEDSKKSVPRRGRPKGSNAKAHIVKHGERVFVRLGYQACTVEDILEEAGVSRTNFYRLFKNKEDVFDHIFQARSGGILELVDLAAQQQKAVGNARDRLEQLFDLYLRTNFSVGELLPILLQEAQALPQYRGLREEIIERFKQIITDIVVSEGFAEPDKLLLEGLLAGIERMVIIEAQRPGDIEDKVEHIKGVGLQFIDFLMKAT